MASSHWESKHETEENEKEKEEEKKEEDDSYVPMDVDQYVTAPIVQHYGERKGESKRERMDSKIFALRSIHNWIKKMQQGYYAPKTANMSSSSGSSYIDLGCGTGPDVRFASQVGFQTCVGLDITPKSIETARSRDSEHSKKHRVSSTTQVTFEVADCHKLLPRFPCLRRMFDVVTCYFSLHYSWETEERARGLLRNVQALLRRDGVFLCTIPNAAAIAARLRPTLDSLQHNIYEFGNDLYKITFPLDSSQDAKTCYERITSLSPSPFGIKYTFRLHGAIDSLPEPLVPLPALERLAREYDLALVDQKPFGDFINERGWSQLSKANQHLLYNMMGISTTTTTRGVSIIPTIPKDQRCIIELYQALVFKKLS